MLERLRLSVRWQRGLMAVVLCMVLLQSVVGMHRVLHVQNASVPPVAAQPSDSLTVGAEPDRSDSSECNKPSLWSDHTRVADCQLFDQACADASPATIWLAAPIIPTPLLFAPALNASWIEQVAFFSARGPPVVC